MPSDPRQTVDRLLKLATDNPNEEEARSSAMAACRLIVKHGLLAGGRTKSVADLFEEMIRQAEEAPPAKKKRGFGFWSDPEPEPYQRPPSPATPPPLVTAKDRQGKTWRVEGAETVYPCVGCHLPIRQGETNYWQRNIHGRLHEACWKGRHGPLSTPDLSDDELEQLWKDL